MLRKIFFIYFLLIVATSASFSKTITQKSPEGILTVETKDGIANGKGTHILFWEKNKYRPENKNNFRQKFEGNFSDGKPSGKGTLTYYDGSKYIGEFGGSKEFGNDYFNTNYGNFRHGKGKHFDEKGKMFIDGEFKNGELNGKATRIYFKGGEQTYKYIGDFKNSKRDGFGTLFFPDGNIYYKGEFKDDKVHGDGTANLRDGRKYQGQFEEGAISGLGIMTYPDGKVIKGVWVKGKLRSRGTE